MLGNVLLTRFTTVGYILDVVFQGLAAGPGAQVPKVIRVQIRHLAQAGFEYVSVYHAIGKSGHHVLESAAGYE
jgi:hypothetical protein